MKITCSNDLTKLGLVPFTARKFALTQFVDLAGLEDCTVCTREGDELVVNPNDYYCAIGNNGDARS